MASVRDVLRQAWIPGLASVSGGRQKGRVEWLNGQTYQIYSPPTGSEIILAVSDIDPLVLAFGGEFNRFATAAFESISHVERIQRFPKATSWLFIKTYYSAFFSLHALSRMFGLSFNHFERSTLDSVKEIADLYGGSDPFPQGGLFACSLDFEAKTLRCTRQEGTSHEVIWKEAVKSLSALSLSVLTFSGTSERLQEVSGLLTRICELLSQSGRFSNFSWLSNFRNRVNYKHDFGAWFPYQGVQQNHVDSLCALVSNWKKDPFVLLPSTNSLSESELFIRTSVTLTSIVREMTLELRDRCSTPGKRSFVCFGPLEFLNRVDQ